MKIVLPENVKAIIETLEGKGFEAYAVGGCVRDACLGRPPQDWDITTNASPQQVKRAFRRTFDTGIEHGTVTVLIGDESFEVTTYRIDGEYRDMRHPSGVSFTNDLREDLRRRDFTINAMAYNDRSGLVDIFGGREDLEARIIRCVGDPDERFGEDALRMMRAVRFASQLGFDIDEKTASSVKKLAGNLRNISAERIQTELSRLLASNGPHMLEKAWELGITKVVLPEFDLMMETPAYSDEGVPVSLGKHALGALKMRILQADEEREKQIFAEKNEKALRYSILFMRLGQAGGSDGSDSSTSSDGSDSSDASDASSCMIPGSTKAGLCPGRDEAARGSVKAGKILRRLRSDRDTIDKVRALIANAYEEISPEPSYVRRLMNRLSPPLYFTFLAMKLADISALAQVRGPGEESAHAAEVLEKAEDTAREILKRGDCLSVKELKITGTDLIADGMKKGKEIGIVLASLLEEVLEDPKKNEPEYLLEKSRMLRDAKFCCYQDA